MSEGTVRRWPDDPPGPMLVQCGRCGQWHSKPSCPVCSCRDCGQPSKWRGDRIGDHGMGNRYYPCCGGMVCQNDDGH